MNRLQAPRPPKYWQLVEQFREDMKRGVLRPGDRLPSLAEMKDRQGISRPTMEKVHQILEADGLIQRRPGLGTFVLQPVRRQTTGLIGVTGWGFRFGGQSSYWANLLGGIREAATQADLQLMLLDHESSSGWEKADGLLLSDYSGAEIRRFVLDEIPCVSVLVDTPGMTSVCADDYSGLRQATEYLIQRGHQRIAYLRRIDPIVSKPRWAGYTDAMQAANLPIDEKWSRCITGLIDYGERFIEAGHQVMEQWLAEDWRKLGCTALIAHNDEVAIGAIAALREGRLDVPGDVSVIGFDGLAIGNYVAPRLTTVEVPLQQIGAKAVQRLCRRLKSDESTNNEPEMIPVQLCERDSVAPR